MVLETTIKSAPPVSIRIIRCDVEPSLQPKLSTSICVSDSWSSPVKTTSNFHLWACGGSSLGRCTMLEIAFGQLHALS